MLTTACWSLAGLELVLGFDLVSGWLVVMHTYLYYSTLSTLHIRKTVLRQIKSSKGGRRSADCMQEGRKFGLGEETRLFHIQLKLRSKQR